MTEAHLPRWVIMEASSVALKLRSEQATCHFFCNVAGVLSTVADACASQGACPGLQENSQQDLHAFALSVQAHLLCCKNQGTSLCQNSLCSYTCVRFDTYQRKNSCDMHLAGPRLILGRMSGTTQPSTW